MHPTPVEKTISNEAIEWFAKLHAGQTLPEDLDRFEAWRTLSPLHAQAYADIEKFWALLDEPAQRVFEQERPRHESKRRAVSLLRGAARRFASPPARRALASLALAAAIAVAAGLPALLRHSAGDYRTGWGERREFALQDGSRVTLNSHSSLSIEFSPERRQVELLEGEAYFQASRDAARPFVVVTAYGTVQVTGTAFDVYRRSDRVTVTVSEGRVKVFGNDAQKKPAELTAGFQTTGDHDGIGPVRPVDAGQATAWREGMLVFDSQPLSAVIDELNRHFSGKLMIVDPRIGERIVSGAFDLDRTPDILPAIETVLGLDSLNFSGTLVLLYRPSL